MPFAKITFERGIQLHLFIRNREIAAGRNIAYEMVRGLPRICNIEQIRTLRTQCRSIPVIENEQSRKLIGIITDRDLCCSVIVGGLDPMNTAIANFMTFIAGKLPRQRQP